MAQNIDTIYILYASQSGTSEYLATELNDQLSSSVVDSIENFEKYLNDEKLEKKSLFLFIISTSIEGSPPDAMTDFHYWMTGASASKLFNHENFEYSILGNGNSNYAETYQQASRNVKTLLSAIKSPFVECREGDQAEGNSEEMLNEWKADIKNKLSQ
ncbi:predicted protein [Naegleria gruberi]|uniref:Predicted protein n=1 Tax=Naegleria gruberi TaxID=5762 RepID=D2VA95_NAEGR|nr:uncharacterized protein NAEGRDRAFT_65781 [Naegleria gruberi]EFC46390.1 predicted protein [Naegleria gruberi]|eukprot:XP_002679134.1 predicted protein [Naegleria gruberi strain NEG-M]